MLHLLLASRTSSLIFLVPHLSSLCEYPALSSHISSLPSMSIFSCLRSFCSISFVFLVQWDTKSDKEYVDELKVQCCCLLVVCGCLLVVCLLSVGCLLVVC